MICLREVKVARLLAEALAAERGPLGEESPLAQDARRRAEEAVREAERLVQEGERFRADMIDPGFTVQRTITEGSAGRMVGELVTSNVYLGKIFAVLDARLGQAGGALNGGGVIQATIYNTVELDGRVLAENTSQHLLQSYQNRAGLQGAAGMPA